MVADEESSSPTTELPMPEELIDPSSDDKTLAICLVVRHNLLICVLRDHIPFLWHYERDMDEITVRITLASRFLSSNANSYSPFPFYSNKAIS